ncbi:hypothetical protein TM5383_01664 [Thalassovita mediterranea]|jgi:hypothetical protein|uniref:Hedgehog/Intein (Hint) domain-containing protein n=2 Tax=Thalassovita mediterranea TaxID=340021 RepID=A0A0P1GPI9_9RHOB|nr:hypothetical protein TM5383_01664 [Thalassovita mediterranea]SIS34261.1 Hint domain-containing protein [Thalassovita mediterranea]
MVAASKLSVNVNASANQMADAIFGSGVTVQDATYHGDARSSGIYSGADETMPGVAPSDSGVILSTGKAHKITNAWGAANKSTQTTTDTNGVDNHAGLNSIAGVETFDAAIFEAEFIPQGNTLSMQLTFSSEEYLEWVDSGFNDAVGIWVNGEQAELTLGDSEISIDEINPDSNPDWYIDNANGDYNTEMDGMTITLTLRAPVKPGELNTLEIGIADAGDTAYDSNLMIKADSIQSSITVLDDEIDLQVGSEGTLDVLANDSTYDGGQLTLTHINNQPLVAGNVITLASGTQISLNPDGTLQITAADVDDESTFTYTVVDGSGAEAAGYVTVSSVPCFVAGTRVDTARGPLPVEQLVAGDLVLTRDHGYQPVRWAGSCHTAVTPENAPIEVAPNALGEHGRLLISPQHRLLIREERVSMLFEANEVLVAAKHLVDGKTVCRCLQNPEVTYVHLLFDRHEVLHTNGIWSESYLPGPEAAAGFDRGAQAEILALFPQLDLATGRGYGPAARMSLRGYEAQALRAG